MYTVSQQSSTAKTSKGVKSVKTDAGLNMDDLEAMRVKYAEERAERMRGDGDDQYIEVTGDFSKFVDDRYADATFSRKALSDEVGVHLAHIIGHALEPGFTTLEVTQEGEEACVQKIIDRHNPAMLPGGTGCTPGCYNNEGRERTAVEMQGAPYGGGAIKLWCILKKWRDAGDVAGLECGTN